MWIFKMETTPKKIDNFNNEDNIKSDDDHKNEDGLRN